MVYLFLAKGFEETEAITVVDILRRAEISIEMVSITDQLEVKGSHDVKIIADTTIDNIDENSLDMIVLPGGLPGSFNLKESKKLAEIIKSVYEKDKYLAAICAAPLVFGELGLLNKKIATCYPGFEKYLSGASTKTDNCVVDRNIITAKGPGAAAEFALKIVEILKDKEVAQQLKESMLWEF